MNYEEAGVAQLIVGHIGMSTWCFTYAATL
jgi:hypothetical protein